MWSMSIMAVLVVSALLAWMFVWAGRQRREPGAVPEGELGT